MYTYISNYTYITRLSSHTRAEKYTQIPAARNNLNQIYPLNIEPKKDYAYMHSRYANVFMPFLEPTHEFTHKKKTCILPLQFCFDKLLLTR